MNQRIFDRVFARAHLARACHRLFSRSPFPVAVSILLATFGAAASAHEPSRAAENNGPQTAGPPEDTTGVESDPRGPDAEATPAPSRLARIQRQDPDGRIFFWPTAFRLEHGEKRFEFSPAGAIWSGGVRGLVNISGGFSFVGALGVSAKVGFDTERLSLAAFGGATWAPGVGDGFWGAGGLAGGGVATLGGRRVFANLAYTIMGFSAESRPYHLCSVGVSAKVHTQVRLIGHVAAAPSAASEDPVLSTTWWLAGLQVWGARLSGTVGGGQFGNLFYETPCDSDECWPDTYPALMVQVAHVW